MKNSVDKKWVITTFIGVFLIGTGGVSAFYKIQDDNNEKILATINARDKAISEKFATKEEAAYIRQALGDLKDGIQLANDRLYDIQRNQVLVKVANDNVVRLQRDVKVANSRLVQASQNVTDLKFKVQQQGAVLQKALEKKKK